MSLFRRHKHNWRLISATNVEGSTYDFPYPPQKYKATRLVLKCDGCTQLKEDRLSGHHAENILKNYEEKK